MKLKLILCLCMLPLFCLAQEAQPQQFSNRYGMKMTQNEDGSYALLYAKKYAKFIDVNTIPDVMVPYTYQPDRLKSKDYKGVATKDIVYKKHKDYELILTVDFAETDKPAPFVVYIHGGGWARGDNGSSRSLSQYLAKQKGITGVRVSYTLAPQSDATVKVSIQDILDFAPGTIIELNKIAGEPIDVLVNGKYVAKGEVVVIEESYGIRITDIVK